MNRVMLRAGVLAIGVLAFAGLSRAEMKMQWELSTPSQPANGYPREDLEVYRQALGVKDIGVLHEAIRALTHYPEGLDLLVKFVRDNPKSNQAAYAAASLLRFAEVEGFEAKIVALRAEYQQRSPAENTPEFQYREQVLAALAEDLYEANNSKYAADYIAVLAAKLKRDGAQHSFGDSAMARIAELAARVPKNQLYPLVPSLVDLLDAFFSDVRTKAHQNLVLITGEKIVFSANWEKSRRAEVQEAYRQLYYTKLKNAATTQPTQP